MDDFRYTKRVAIRFGDLDTLGHVNNVAYARYLEEARGGYYDEVVGVPFEALGTVIAELHVTYERELTRDRVVSVAVRVPKLGDSSVPMEYEIRSTDPETGETSIAATAETVQVNVDPETGRAESIPDAWREAITEFEGL